MARTRIETARGLLLAPILAPLLIPLLILGSAACSDGSPQIERATTAISLTDAIQPIEGLLFFDLVAGHDAAERWFEVEGIEPARLEQRRHLTRGWSYPPHSRDTDREELWPLWADAKQAEITFALSEPAERHVELRINPYHIPLEKNEGEVDVTIRLNDKLIEARAIDRRGKKLSLNLPIELQQVGLNRLGFEFSDLWRVSEETDSDDLRTVAANVGLVRFVTDDEEARRRFAEAATLVPEGSRVPQVGPGAGLVVEQVSGSVLTYYLRAPEHGHFKAKAYFGARGERRPEKASFRVVLTTEDEQSRWVVDHDVAFGSEPVELDAELREYAGQIIRLDLEVAAADGSNEPVLGTWIQPLVTTDAPVVGTPEHELVAGLREKLRDAPVVLVLLDALNPAFISCYGGRRGLTPNLDRLASEGTLFSAAHAQASYTVASVPSTLTSLYSWEHGSWNERGKLLEEVPTWPEQFAAAGYRTSGIVHSPNGSSLFGFERGFEHYDEVFRNVEEGRVTALAEQVLPALDAVLSEDDERPPFLWLHIVEPHEPYLPPAPFAGKFSKLDDGGIRGDAETLWKIREWKLRPTPEEIAELEAQYEDNLAYVDDVFGQVREKLTAAGIWDEAVIAVFSDHGEGFLEHEGKIFSGCGHGSTVYDEMTRIPLIVRLPEGLAPRGWRVREPTANLDLLPTVADLVGVPPLEGARGKSFASLFFDGGRPTRELVVSHSASFMDERRFVPAFSIRMGDFKYIHTSGDRPELYDVAKDPAEKQNVVDTYPVLAGYLRQELRALGFDVDRGDVDFEGREAAEIDEDLERQLQALGYGR